MVSCALWHNVPHLSMGTGEAAKGRRTCGHHAWGGVLWLEGHRLLLGACVTAGSRTAPRSEASLPKEMGKTGSAP